MGLKISTAQLENLVCNNADRLEDDHGLNEWLPGVAADVRSVDVGLWRCPSGEITCDEGCCGDCDCCDNSRLWESPFDWQVECPDCGQPAFLVECVGRFDLSAALA
jgi:hypothetical protein